MIRDNPATIVQRNPLPFVARGALGGAIVGFILILVSVITYKITLGYIPYAYLFIIPSLPMILGLPAVIGALIGTSIWILSVISGRTFGIAGRAIIGFVTALILLSLYAYFLCGYRMTRAREEWSTAESLRLALCKSQRLSPASRAQLLLVALILGLHSKRGRQPGIPVGVRDFMLGVRCARLLEELSDAILFAT